MSRTHLSILLFFCISFLFTSSYSSFQSYLLSSSLLYILKPSSKLVPELWHPSTFPVFRFVREYRSYVDTRGLTNICEGDCSLTVCDQHNVLRYTDVCALVKHWLHCRGNVLSVLCDASSEAYCTFIRFDEEVEPEKYPGLLSSASMGRCCRIWSLADWFVLFFQSRLPRREICVLGT